MGSPFYYLLMCSQFKLCFFLLLQHHCNLALATSMHSLTFSVGQLNLQDNLFLPYSMFLSFSFLHSCEDRTTENFLFHLHTHSVINFLLRRRKESFKNEIKYWKHWMSLRLWQWTLFWETFYTSNGISN